MKLSTQASTSFYNDIENSPRISSMCFIECDIKAFRIVKLNWGVGDDYERSNDGEADIISLTNA